VAGFDSQWLVHRSLLGEAVDAAASVAVFVWDEDRNYVAVNDVACAITGLTRAQLIGMPVGDMSPDRAADMIAATQREPLLRGRTTFTRTDQAIVELEFVTVHTRIAGLPYMVSFCWPPG
jgi:PAS domain S-box-containing protein